MSKKLLSEAQVRKFMGLANLNGNVSSNFINEMYHEDKEEDAMEEGMHDKKEEDMHAEGMHDKKEEDMHEELTTEEEVTTEGAHEEADMEMDAELDGGEPEEADESEVDVELDQDEVAEAKAAADKLVDLLNKLMGGAPAEIDDAPAEEPEMEMDAEEELGLDETTTTPELTEDEIVQEVAKRVAKRINEAAKKSNK